jgi:hypothetical protein
VNAGYKPLEVLLIAVCVTRKNRGFMHRGAPLEMLARAF